MRVRLDECVDRRLARDILGHDVRTVPESGWAALKNGDLLARAEREFEAFVTVDRNLPGQQDLSRFSIAVIVLRARSNRIPICAASFRSCSRLSPLPSAARSLGLASNHAVERTRFARRSSRAICEKVRAEDGAGTVEVGFGIAGDRTGRVAIVGGPTAPLTIGRRPTADDGGHPVTAPDSGRRPSHPRYRRARMRPAGGAAWLAEIGSKNRQ